MKRSNWILAASLLVVVLATSLTSEAGKGKRKGKKTEQQVTLEQVPPKVKATILKEAGENEIEEIEKVSLGKKVLYYEAEWMEGENEVEIKVAPSGKLLDKEVEKADEDDDEDAEDEDDDGDDDD